MSNNPLFDMIDEKIKGYQEAIRNSQSHSHKNPYIDMWLEKKAYWEYVREVLIENIDDISIFEFIKTKK